MVPVADCVVINVTSGLWYNQLRTTRSRLHNTTMNSDSIFDTNWNDASEEGIAYSRPAVSALVSAVLGLAAFLVFFSWLFFFIGVIAVLLSFFALWTIRNAEGILTGKVFAYTGLCTALTALTAVTVFWSAYHHGLRREAGQFFRMWFVAVQEGDIPRAKEYQSIYPYRSSAANAEEWWETQYAGRFSHRAVHQFVEDELIRVLMALGGKARVTYYKTLEITTGKEEDRVESVFAVTFPAESGRTETFFVRINGIRTYPYGLPDFKAAGWRIEEPPAFYLPDEFK